MIAESDSPSRLGWREYATLLRTNRNYRLLWMAQIVSEIGDWLYAVVIYDLLLERTGMARSVATAVILQTLPQMLVSPMAGVVNDRLRRCSVMIGADFARFAIVGAMLWAVHLESIWPLYVLLVLETAMWGFFEPGRSALLPNLVSSRRETLVANTLSSTTWSFNLAIGSALGGLLGVWLGRNAVFVINAGTFLVSAVLIMRMRVEEPHAANMPPLRVADLFDFSPVVEGFRYIFHHKRLLATLLSKAGLGFMGANYIILSVFGERVFRMGASAMLGMSLLMGARGVGSLIGPVLGGYWASGDHRRLRRGILFGFFAASAGYVALAFAPDILTAMACVTLAHAGGATIWVFSTTMIQHQADDRFRGRVFSADFAFLVMAMTASTWLSGSAVDAGAAIRHVSIAVGVLILVPAALWAVLALPLWRESSNP
ncbi:MAG: MFS transporter [Bryobacteraceae bacterium]